MDARKTELADIPIYVDGNWIGPEDRDHMIVTDPNTGQPTSKTAVATADDLDAALDAVNRAFDFWSNTPAVQRAGILKAIACVIGDRKEDIARTIATEQGKPILQSRGEVDGAIEAFEWFAEECRRTYGRLVPSPDPSVNIQVRLEPIGPSVIFTPWNFPFAEMAIHLSAALAAGCTAIVKAPQEAPRPGMKLMRAIIDAGAPEGIVQFVLGRSAAISDHLVTSPVIRKIGFKAAAEMKNYTMELGGNAPVLIFDDFEVDLAVDRLVPRKLRNSGQVCTSPNRFFVHDRIHDHFVERYAAAISAARLGSALEETTEMGPLVNERRVFVMTEFCEDATAKGAKIVAGGEPVDRAGCFFPQTVVTDIPENALLAREEVYGPISPIFRFDDFDDVIRRANAVDVGLSSYVFTNNISVAQAASERLRTGTVSINHGIAQYIEAPFGGVKDTGQGRLGGIEGLNAYLTTKTVSTHA